MAPRRLPPYTRRQSAPAARAAATIGRIRVVGVGEQPGPQLDRVLGPALGTAVADAVQLVAARHPADPVGRHRSLSFCRRRRAAKAPVSMLMLSSWKPGGS